MKTIRTIAVAAFSAFAQAAFAGATTECATEGYGPEQYEVYIDPSSGDAFIRTPCGWRFIRTIEPARIAEAIRLTRVQPPDLEREDALERRDDPSCQ